MPLPQRRILIGLGLSAAILWNLGWRAEVPADAQAADTPAAAPAEAAPKSPDDAKPSAEASPAAEKTPASEASAAAEPELQTVEQLAASARRSVVVISHHGRDGKQSGIGSGVIIEPDGLVATNLHVIGEGRPIKVQTLDGKQYKVLSVRASDRLQDMALLEIDGRDLPALPLGDSDSLKQGQAVVAIGNPQGLKHSVVQGIVSGRREIDNKKMIQLAIPIEPGNSGGPLLDMYGRVHGLLTIKSLVTDNLGFAVESNTLKKLIERPNPIPIARWLTIGRLNDKEWSPQLDANWRQRAGRILVEGLGSGFGGRSYCLWLNDVPEVPFEVAVDVKLEDEAGAAGLIFCADGDRHYGFYPTGGQLRLTRFEGYDLSSWTILHNAASRHYRPGEFNRLKVRIEPDKLLCYVNDELAIEIADQRFRDGQVGLTKFRQTSAEFKRFAVAQELPNDAPNAEVASRIFGLIGEIAPDRPVDTLVEKLLPEADHVAVLESRAARLEKQAQLLRQLARDVDVRRQCQALAEVLDGDEESIDLLHACLLIARLDDRELDVESYRRQFAQLAAEMKEGLPADADEAARLARIKNQLFEEYGFHGSRSDYYNAANSYMNQVFDDREGLPLSLSILYMECARQLGLNVVGVGLPGHFVVKYVPGDDAAGQLEQVIDVYEGGKPLSRDEVRQLVLANTGEPLRDEHLQPTTKKAIAVRMLHNLAGVARRQQDAEKLLVYYEALVALQPDSGGDRWLRAVLRYQTQRKEGARADVEHLLEHEPAGVNLLQVQALKQLLDQAGP